MLLQIHEEAYRFRRLRKIVRGEVHSPEWQAHMYAKKDKMEWDNSELGVFMDLIRNHSKKELRNYLLDHGSKIVRVGKKTRKRKKKNV